MQTLKFYQFGEPSAVLQLEEGVIPDVLAGRILLRLTHRAINPSDLLTIRGEYGRLPTLPAVGGHEGVGVITAVGEGVEGWQVGQRVVPLSVTGTWQTYVIAHPGWLVAVPDSVSNETAAQFLVNPVTAWVMLVDELTLQPGDWLVQTAAGSTLGRFVLQIAQLKGFRTVNLVRRQEQVAELLALGADAVICTGEGNVVEQIRQLTGGKGAKGAIDAVGGQTGALALQGVRSGGTMLVYGLLSNQPVPVHSGEMLFRGLTIRGFWLAHWLRVKGWEERTAVLQELMALMAAGHLSPPVAASYDLTEFRAAVAHAERSGRRGKVLLTG